MSRGKATDPMALTDMGIADDGRRDDNTIAAGNAAVGGGIGFRGSSERPELGGACRF